MNQRQAVYYAVRTLFEEFTEDFEDGHVVELTKDQREAVRKEVCQGFNDGDIDFSESAKAKYNTDAKLNGYVSGLISNWLRKDNRLNGDVKYVPKNPGSRAGQGDPQVRELRKLKKIHMGTEKEAEIQGFIDNRLKSISKDKVKKIDIDYSQLPKELQDLAPKQDDETEE